MFVLLKQINKKKHNKMRTEIEIIRTDDESQKGFIIGLRQDKVIVENITLGEVQIWDLEDLKQCIDFV